MLEQVGYASDPEALPTLEAIGELAWNCLAEASSSNEIEDCLGPSR